MKELKKIDTGIMLKCFEDGKEYPLYRLNMPIIDAFQYLGAATIGDFYRALKEKLDFPASINIAKSKEDKETQDYIHSIIDDEGEYQGPEGMESFYRNLANVLMNMI